jgi:hypothetical protein
MLMAGPTLALLALLLLLSSWTTLTVVVVVNAFAGIVAVLHGESNMK